MGNFRDLACSVLSGGEGRVACETIVRSASPPLVAAHRAAPAGSAAFCYYKAVQNHSPARAMMASKMSISGKACGLGIAGPSAYLPRCQTTFQRAAGSGHKPYFGAIHQAQRRF
jgi:hypothetical protein